MTAPLYFEQRPAGRQEYVFLDCYETHSPILPLPHTTIIEAEGASLYKLRILLAQLKLVRGYPRRVDIFWISAIIGYMRKLLSQIIAATLGLWLATLLVPYVSINLYPDSSFFGILLSQEWQITLLLGTILGLLNFFVKPVLNTITLPLRVITLGLFGIVINMGLIWILEIMFKELMVPWFFPLLWTTLIIWILTIVFSRIFLKKED